MRHTSLTLSSLLTTCGGQEIFLEAKLPTLPPSSPAATSLCEEKCVSDGHCCTGAISSFQHPSCAMGCIVAKHTSSVSECQQECRDNDNKCTWTIAGIQMSQCSDCPSGCDAGDGVQECLTGCEHGFSPAPPSPPPTPPTQFTVLNPADYAEVLGDDYSWAIDNIPFIDVEEPDVQLAYYFRWRSYKKHIKPVTDAACCDWVVDEFLPDVPWSGKDNTISCAAGHHFMEGRWLRNDAYLDSYARFWFKGGGSPGSYTFWAAWAYHQRYLVNGDEKLILELYPDLKEFYAKNKAKHYNADYGCMWGYSDRDGQENSIGGDGCRPVLNSVMYGEATALTSIAALAGDSSGEALYKQEAEQWRQVVLGKLWSEDLGFFSTLNVPKPNAAEFLTSAAMARVTPPSNFQHFDSNIFCCDQSPCVGGHSTFLYEGRLTVAQCFQRCDSIGDRCQYTTASDDGYCILAQFCNTTDTFASGGAETFSRVDPAPPSPPTPAPVSTCRPQTGKLATVREIQGLSSPWYFGVPSQETAATYAGAWATLFDDQGFAGKWGPRTAELRSPCYNYSVNHECNWNGPSWPFETSKAITGAANVLNDYPAMESGLDRNRYFELLQQYARSHTRMTAINAEPWLVPGTDKCWIGEDFHPDDGYWLARQIMYDSGNSRKDRGNNYNHSTFCDLVLSGLFGLRPGSGGKLIINPLVPTESIRYFAADGVKIQGHNIAVVYDADGTRYGKGKGLTVWVDGKLAASAGQLQKLSVQL